MSYQASELGMQMIIKRPEGMEIIWEFSAALYVTLLAELSNV